MIFCFKWLKLCVYQLHWLRLNCLRKSSSKFWSAQVWKNHSLWWRSAVSPARLTHWSHTSRTGFFLLMQKRLGSLEIRPPDIFFMRASCTRGCTLYPSWNIFGLLKPTLPCGRYMKESAEVTWRSDLYPTNCSDTAITSLPCTTTPSNMSEGVIGVRDMQISKGNLPPNLHHWVPHGRLRNGGWISLDLFPWHPGSESSSWWQ